MYKRSLPRGSALLLASILFYAALVGCSHAQQETGAVASPGAADDRNEAPQKAAQMKTLPNDFKKR